MKLSDNASISEPIRGLVYGPSGCGKTTLLGLLAQFEEFRPVYFFDWDLRIQSLRAKIPQEYWQYIEAEPYRDKNIGGEAVLLMQAKIERLEKEGYKSVIVDSYTFAMRGMMARVLQLDGGKPITTTPQLQHYMAQMNIAEDTVAKACSKSFNFFITCHEDTSKDEVTGRLFKSVDLTGKMASRLPGYFNEFWHCEIRVMAGGEQSFVVRTRSDNVYGARTSFRVLDTVEPQDSIWQKIKNSRTKMLNEPTGIKDSKTGQVIPIK